ncbi:MAG: elongation factor G, partial [Caulobacterales bacterium]|nr:elongation factor G [Caulobacterales bacterium]
YLDDRYWVMDTPGSSDFAADGTAAIAAADVAVIVAEPDPDKAVALQIALKRIDALGVPTMLFVNKIDQARGRVRDLLAALQEVSEKPLVMRQIPIWEGDQVNGFIDLALERAYVYRAGRPSQQVDIPSALADREADARFQMLERLADFDESLMEALIEDEEPDPDTIFTDLATELRGGRITPVFLGSALTGGGVRRLLKALRHETPSLEETAARLLGAAPSEPAALVVKTRHAGQAGKQSVARVLAGPLEDGASVRSTNGVSARVGGVTALMAGAPVKRAAAEPGDVAVLSRLGDIATGEVISAGAGLPTCRVSLAAAEPVCARSVAAKARADEVKMAAAIAKLVDEDPGLVYGPDVSTGQLVLRGQGQVHLDTAIERMKSEFGVELSATRPATPYRETMRKGVTARGRHKKQSGGHGQFGDVVLEARPLERGGGFAFETRITGGVVPRQYFSAVEHGVEDALAKGPLGFPVIDVAAVLVDGSHHSVDSSEIAFRTAGRIGMSAAMEEAKTVLLEPVWRVVIHAPSDAVSAVTRVVAEREGRMLGIDQRPDWQGWDDLSAYLPHAALDGLIIELRSATQGAATFEAEFEHYAEVVGRRADKVLEEAASAA